MGSVLTGLWIFSDYINNDIILMIHLTCGDCVDNVALEGHVFCLHLQAYQCCVHFCCG